MNGHPTASRPDPGGAPRMSRARRVWCTVRGVRRRCAEWHGGVPRAAARRPGLAAARWARPGTTVRVFGLVCVVLVGVSACGSEPVAPGGATVRVRIGSVTRTATATGALSGVTAGGPGSVAVVPFGEADAAAIRPGQPARLSVTAIPGLFLAGTVQAVAPDAVVIDGVTNYYVTIVATDWDARLRAGQSVIASVTTEGVHGVLVVPNSAVSRPGGGHPEAATIITPGPDGRLVRTPFTAGAVGDDTTQVVAGLREGQPVLLPGPR